MLNIFLIIEDFNESFIPNYVEFFTEFNLLLKLVSYFLFGEFRSFNFQSLDSLSNDGRLNLLAHFIPLFDKFLFIHHFPVCSHSTMFLVEGAESFFPHQIHGGHTPVKVWLIKVGKLFQREMPESLIKLKLEYRHIFGEMFMELVGGDNRG